MRKELMAACERYENWLVESALPLWLDQGMRTDPRASHERLLPSGMPDRAANIRTRVQARQIFVFSMAHKLGWCDGKAAADAMTAFLENHGRHPAAANGFIHLLTPELTLADSKQDLYDHAFFILAFTWRYRAFGDPADLTRAEGLVQYLDDTLGAATGGWYEGDYATRFRRQNPHMHLFEAFLALFEATEDKKWRTYADSVFDLFENHFYDPGLQVLFEYFNEDWSRADPPDGLIVEPGHMMEWVWLMRTYQRLGGRDTSRYADALYSNGLELGLTGSGLLFDSVDPRGTVLQATKRCWPMTELIKASIVQARAGHADGEENAARAINTLFDFYLDVATPGAYIDQVGADDEVTVDAAPASTLYHLIMAAAEVSAYCRGRY